MDNLSKTVHTDTYLRICELALKNNHFFKISTMTMVFKLDHLVDIQRLYETEVLHDKVKQKIFYNQITISLKDWSHKSAKIFKNGNVHITGIASLYDFDLTKDTILELLNEHLSSTFTIVEGSIKLLMINGCFNIHSNIKLHSLGRMFQDKTYTKTITYSPQKYPAINLKTIYRSSAFIFRTGKIIVTSTSIIDIYKTYTSISKDLSYSSKSQNNKNQEKKKHFKALSDVTICGYDIKQYGNCIM